MTKIKKQYIMYLQGENMKYSFPAVFEQDQTDKNFINVTFPDLMGVVTCGQGMEDARFMAKDVLKSMLAFDYVKNTVATSLEKTAQNFKGKIVEMVEVEV